MAPSVGTALQALREPLKKLLLRQQVIPSEGRCHRQAKQPLKRSIAIREVNENCSPAPAFEKCALSLHKNEPKPAQSKNQAQINRYADR
jgi:hypothetical protein